MSRETEIRTRVINTLDGVTKELSLYEVSEADAANTVQAGILSMLGEIAMELARMNDMIEQRNTITMLKEIADGTTSQEAE